MVMKFIACTKKVDGDSKQNKNPKTKWCSHYRNQSDFLSGQNGKFMHVVTNMPHIYGLLE
jgi:hypothetical protein